MPALNDTDLALEGLRACRLFAGVGDAQLAVLARSMRARRFRDGETIFHQDDPADGLHVVAGGGVRIVLPSAEEAEPAILTTLAPGEFFGALALLDEEPRSATAVAIGRTQTLVLRRDAFLGLIDADAALRRALLASLAHEVRRLTAHVHDLHFLDLPARLAHRILREAAAVRPAPGDASAPGGPSAPGLPLAGLPTPSTALARGPVTVPWPYTQTELAGMIGGSRQSVNRVLADFSANGLIRLERGSLVIPDPDALERAVAR